jgi:hypothetical protein
MASLWKRAGETGGGMVLRAWRRGSRRWSAAGAESAPRAFLVSTAVVGLAEIGDKTQILSLMQLSAWCWRTIGDKTQIATIGLAARFEAFYPIVIGTSARKKAQSVDRNAPDRLIPLSSPSYLSGNSAHTATLRKEIPRVQRIPRPLSKLPKKSKH